MKNDTDIPASLFRGAPVSTGVGMGRAYLIYRKDIAVPRYRIRKREIKKELRRFEDALQRVEDSFRGLRSSLEQAPSKDPLLILQTHLDLLRDPQIRDRTRVAIEENQENAEWSLWQVCQDIRRVFENIEDEYIRARAEDIDHLCNRIVAELGGEASRADRTVGPEDVIVAKELAPDDAIYYAQLPVAAFVCEGGSRVSHSAIIARTFNIPTVMGVEGIAETLTGGEMLLVDGDDGSVHIEPPKPLVNKAQKRRKAQLKRQKQMLARVDEPAITPDDVQIELLANIELPEEIDLVKKYGGAGVGLYRTEYLFLNRDTAPNLDELTEHYSGVARELQGLPVTFRTIDIGGDKLPKSIAMQIGKNPAMGLRGIRYSLTRPELFRDQIRAILRAQREGPVRILLPLVSGHEELLQALGHIDSVQAEEGCDRVPVGVMIETPSSVMTADILARKADFFSVGTNDLIQYALAIDRTDDTVAYLYAPLHLGILRMLRHVNQVGHDAGVPVGMCGEVAGDPMFLPVLLGMGVRSFSMAPSAIPLIREMIRRTPVRDAERIVQGIFSLQNPSEIRDILNRELDQRYRDLLELD